MDSWRNSVVADPLRTRAEMTFVAGGLLPEDAVIGHALCVSGLDGVRQAQVVLEDGPDHSLNWGLIVGFVCCIEFWIAVTTAVLDL